MADIKDQKTKRQIFTERFRAKHPERQWSDDDSDAEDRYEAMNGDYDEYEKEIGDYKSREGKLTELFTRDPKSAAFITDMAKGKDPWISIIERLGIDGITDLMNDPAKQEEYAAANKKYVERIAKERGYEDEYNKNLDESLATIAQVQKEQGLSDETIDAAMDFIMKVTNEAIMGKFTSETLDMAFKAINHDTDVTNASAEGVIAGKNAKIEEKLRKPNEGDGLPNMAGANNSVSKPKGSGSIFDIAASAR